ncbi:universal stress protein [Nocardia donostiensis]|uniref:Universal stress protein n=1 Tax=Nocardia donostiensis TaxID=1538463 RepID=A0A1V2TH66_9NOCA|nr:universal stress protein [Nocardia donostiensis]ONM48860.1 universal stress protein [Nocardia donostiensis]OQS15518.1 universal stress protein [Nocardia donostiensis]OQS22884.1 universal stress protein [Nocardia donostiensis]
MRDEYLTDTHQLVSAAVVVGAEGTPASDLAVGWAAEAAAQRKRTLVIAHGMNLYPARALLAYGQLVDEASATLRRHGERVLAAARRIAREVDPHLAVETALSDDSGAKLLIELSKSAHLVALGAAAGGSLSHLGSSLLAVTSHGHGAIVAVRESSTGQGIRHSGPVVVGVDGSRSSDTAIAAAFAEAAERETELVAVHAWSDLAFADYAGTAFVDVPVADLEAIEQAVLAERLAGWQEKYPDVPVVRKMYPASPRKHLLEWSETAQLLVVGSRGRGGFRGLLLGSTSNALVQHARCPVMVTHTK